VQFAAQRKRLPDLLVTTPESLTLMLAHPETQARFAALDVIIVDEWHELLGNKRGVQTQLALARLRRWRPDTLIWGLSATLHGRITFKDGQPEQSSYRDFPVMRLNETPTIEIHVVPSRLRPFGAGEQPVPPVYAAVANAVFAATGQRLRELPLRLDPEPSANLHRAP